MIVDLACSEPTSFSARIRNQINNLLTKNIVPCLKIWHIEMLIFKLASSENQLYFHHNEISFIKFVFASSGYILS
jgi:hypothetical protein